jgi:hypothetical protein
MLILPPFLCRIIIILIRRSDMAEYKIMSLKERLAIGVKAHELREAGKEDEALALDMTIPLAPFLAKIAKEKIGPEFLLKSGLNLSEAEAEFGKNWLTR